MLTYAAPYYNAGNHEGFPALPTDGEAIRAESAFATCPTLELWDCEHGSLAAGEARRFRVQFTKGQSVRLRAWAKATIGISIQDISGRTVARENHADGHPNCLIQPSRSGEYLLQVVNTTEKDAHYVLYIADESIQAV